MRSVCRLPPLLRAVSALALVATIGIWTCDTPPRHTVVESRTAPGSASWLDGRQTTTVWCDTV